MQIWKDSKFKQEFSAFFLYFEVAIIRQVLVTFEVKLLQEIQFSFLIPTGKTFFTTTSPLTQWNFLLRTQISFGFFFDKKLYF